MIYFIDYFRDSVYPKRSNDRGVQILYRRKWLLRGAASRGVEIRIAIGFSSGKGMIGICDFNNLYS